MALPFSYVCDLFDQLHELDAVKFPPLTRAKRLQESCSIVKKWFKAYQGHIKHTDPIAILSTLLPHRRPDRVYGFQESRMINVLSRSLGWGSTRVARLRSWEQARDDFATHVYKIHLETDAGCSFPSKSVEDVDGILTTCAAQNHFSGPDITKWRIGKRDSHEVLKTYFKTMRSKELKGMLRLILHVRNPLTIDDDLVLSHIHQDLPRLVKLQDNLLAATEAIKQLPASTDQDDVTSANENDLEKYMKPQPGVKVGRPDFIKARSIYECYRIVKSSDWIVEPKYDGEYCQIHINLDKPVDWIQIFSKSGKDSTKDRINIHHLIKAALKIDQPECRIKRHCIIEGELVVFDNTNNRILEFHRIRKHVSRSGQYIAAEDSQIESNETLGFVAYDVLLVDEEILLMEPWITRRKRMGEILTVIPGQVQKAEYSLLKFTDYVHTPARVFEKLEKSFAKAIALRCEGLILKPAYGAYLCLGERTDDELDGQIIKLKKDAIPGLGDNADFAVIAGNYSSAEATHTRSAGPKWTSFVIACLTNKPKVVQGQEIPIFMPIARITGKFLWQHAGRELNDICRFREADPGSSTEELGYRVIDEAKKYEMQTFFRNPPIVEVLGAGFDQHAGSKYHMLRFAQIIKVHGDRGISEVVSFEELQELAQNAVNLPSNLQDEEQKWRKLLREKSKSTGNQDLQTSPYAVRNSRAKTTSSKSHSRSASRGKRRSRSASPLGVFAILQKRSPAEQAIIDWANAIARFNPDGEGYTDSRRL